MRPKQFSTEEILAATRCMVLEHGPEVSTTEIAKLVGMSQATLFKRFGSKQALMRQALRPPTDIPWFRMLETLPDERPMPEQLLELVTTISEFFDSMSPMIRRMHQCGLMPEWDGETELPPVRARRLLAEFFARAQAQGRVRIADPAAAATMLLGLAQLPVFFHHMFGAPPPDVSLIQQGVTLLWVGMDPAAEDST